jgi:hypothetical protein
MLTAEIEGGIWLIPNDPDARRSSHTICSGYEADCKKHNTATLQGWHIHRFTPTRVRSVYALRLISRYFSMSYTMSTSKVMEPDGTRLCSQVSRRNALTLRGETNSNE